jgi:hypothetical protein
MVINYLKVFGIEIMLLVALYNIYYNIKID